MHDRLRHGTYVTNQKTGALQAHSAAKPLDGLRCDYAKAKTMARIGLPTAAQGTARGFFGSNINMDGAAAARPNQWKRTGLDL